MNAITSKLFTLMLICSATLLTNNSEAKTPKYFTIRPAGARLDWPFNSSGTPLLNKIQVIYPPRDYASIGPGKITAIYFKYYNEPGVPYAGTYTFSNLNIKLGTYAKDTFLPTTTSFISGLTTVLSSATYSVVIPSPDFDGFWVRFPLTTSYYYDPNSGKNLLVEVSQGPAVPTKSGFYLDHYGGDGSPTTGSALVGNVTSGYIDKEIANPVFGYDIEAVGVNELASENEIFVSSYYGSNKLSLGLNLIHNVNLLSIKLLNTASQEVYADRFMINGKQARKEISLPRLSEGMYFLVIDIGGKQYIRKVVL
jgi:hypothetical protein